MAVAIFRLPWLAVTSAERWHVAPMLSPSNTRTFPVKDYDLAATLSSGQAFRWRKDGESWAGVIGRHWLRLRSDQFSIAAETAEPLTDWLWLTDYLQLD